MRPNPSPRLSRFIARFARAERGVTAIEFALVSLPMLMLVFGLIEIAMVFLVGATLDQATQSASRMIRTGEFQNSAAVDQTAFKNLVCLRMSWLQSKCNANLFVDVQTYSDYATLAAQRPLDASTFDPNNPVTCFKVGQPKDIVGVRTYFQWTLFTPLLSVAMQNMPGGKRLITSTTAFVNEPYNQTSPIGQACH